jgi:hypothetical protein
MKITYENQITGHLDIFVGENEEDVEGKVEKWFEILIHGDPEGLRSLAALLIKLADLDQDNMADLPEGAREHFHLRPRLELSASSDEVVVGRLDAKGTGRFYERYVARKK